LFVVVMTKLVSLTLAFLALAVRVHCKAKEAHVVELTDKTFEHDTQASSGSTTGDWFVKFHASWCGHCKKLAPIWEDLAHELHHEVNVAKVDVPLNAGLGRRFNIKGYPTLILFRKGKMYEYASGNRSLEQLKEFALGGYQHVASADIPLPPTFLSVVKGLVAESFQQVPHVAKGAPGAAILLSLGGLVLGFFVGIIVSMFASAVSKPKQGRGPNKARKAE